MTSYLFSLRRFTFTQHRGFSTISQVNAWGYEVGGGLNFRGGGGIENPCKKCFVAINVITRK